MNKKRQNTLFKPFSGFRPKSKAKNSKDLSETQTVKIDMNSQFYKQRTEDSILSKTSSDFARCSVAETLTEVDLQNDFSLQQGEYENALNIVKNYSSSQRKKTFKQRLSGLRSAVRMSEHSRRSRLENSSQMQERVDNVNEHVPSAEERFQMHLQEEFQREIWRAEKIEHVPVEEILVAHKLNGSETEILFFRSQAGGKVIDLIRGNPIDRMKGLSQKTIENSDEGFICFNSGFIRKMKRMGLNDCRCGKFPIEIQYLPEEIAAPKAERVGIHVDDIIVKIKSDAVFKQKIIENNFPNQRNYKSLFGEITEEFEDYFVVPDDDDVYGTENGIPSDIASVPVKIVDSDSSSVQSSLKEHPLHKKFLPGEYQEIERSFCVLHKRGVSDGYRQVKSNIGAQQLKKLNQLLDGTNPNLAPSQLQQLEHALFDEDGAIRLRNSHNRHKSSPLKFTPQDLKSVVKFLFPETTKDALMVEGITAKAMQEFKMDSQQKI